MAARICEVQDAVVTLLAAAQADAVPVAAFAVADATAGPTGKRVRVFPGAYGDVERTARKRKIGSRLITVVIEETYPEPASASPDGSIPAEWVKANIAWVETYIFGVLNNTGVHVEDGDRLLGALWPEACEVTVVVDPARLEEHKEFLSLVEVEYREFLTEA